MAIIENSTFKTYANYKVSDVPLDNLKKLVTLFLDHAALNMGASVEKANCDRVIEIIQGDFAFMPVNQISSAFSKGSMGYWGEGRLIPKNINNWLKEMKSEYDRYIEHKDREQKLSLNNPHFKDLVKYPLGKAICKKIDWYKSGVIDGDDWDKIPLKELSEIIGNGGWPTPTQFGIEPKK